MSDRPERFPFFEWIEAARPRAQLWRTAVGAGVIAAVWLAWTLALMFVAIGGGLIDPAALGAVIGATYSPLGYWETIIALLVALGTILGFAVGVWGVLRVLHARGLASLVAWNRRFSFREFGAGGAVAALYLAISLGWSAVTGHLPRRSDVTLEQWGLALAPVGLVIFLQASSEELVFRGYLPQQLAARFRNPAVWGLLPSILFGALHAGNMPGDPEFMPYLIVSASVLGLVMMALVWRTGGLAAAIGFHLVNNIVALTVAGADAGPSTVALFVWSPAEMIETTTADLLIMGLLLAFVLSPWAPLPGRPQLSARRKDTRAAP